ncbi:hypothetical protein A3765_03565 [Oleiphilus sp. HI0130]|uniref:murein hydrolase activator EnvC family protein n=3 Tax=unclassified Oleiphilus TaxID=2631174 RepID=UPI0007C2A532|nr:peptidoglycan DD-metalloendopeptidase family protein [Oleiphilus sp. HI0079]KZY91925.1 hypothetical protein A3744_03535 [Oleiphilus sp. HI0073]KZZ10352.1 hypothetical protein A3750_07875 [Oleiphilus sp. HI0079]KZZ49875.1 hypothetical protein A3758_13555 [Oleiphilus sp. HI0118]KZZ69771.1 hypothetical protein A3765_03565 [Oleiphilus sp. HI0130]
MLGIFAFCSWLLLIPLSLEAPTALAASQEESEEQLKKLKKSISEISVWLKNANREKSGLIAKLREQEKEISTTSLAIKQNKADIAGLLKDLSELNIQLREQKKSLRSQQSYLVDELRALYLEGRQPAIKALLDQNNPQDSSRYLGYFNYVHKARSEKVAQFMRDVEHLEDTQATILRRQTEVNAARETLQTKRKLLEQQSAQRKLTLAKVEKSIQNKTSELEQLKQNQTRLETLLREVEKSISELKLPDESTPFRKQKAKLPWPTRGKVIERFGSRQALGKLRSNGIRIAAREDAKVSAVHYGHVVFSDWLRGFGLLIIIDHGDGYLSLYGNNESLLREAGDWVRPGEVLAYAGNSGGRSQASLYFEIRKNGKPQNPLRWLKR